MTFTNLSSCHGFDIRRVVNPTTGRVSYRCKVWIDPPGGASLEVEAGTPGAALRAADEAAGVFFECRARELTH